MRIRAGERSGAVSTSTEWHVPRASVKSPTFVAAPRPAPRKRSSSARVVLPAIKPMLAVHGAMPADPSRYAFEYKWDGVRAIGYCDGRTLRLESRNGNDITIAYPELAPLADAIGRPCILDGEIIALDDVGRPSFGRLQQRMHVRDVGRTQRLAKLVPVWYAIFDVLHVDGESLFALPFRERRERLEELTVAGSNWHVSPSYAGEGDAVLRAATDNQLEGIVAKELESPYEPGRRSPAWLKIKLVMGQELVIGGWLPESGVAGSKRIGAILMGYYDCDGKLRYAGAVGTGFTGDIHADLYSKLSKRVRPTSPFADNVPAPRAAATFVEPELVAHVEYRRWPKDGMLQQAAYKGLRDDKPAREVVRET